MWETVIAACGGAAIAVIGQVIMWAANRKAARTDRGDAEADMVMEIAYDRIKFLAKRAIEHGRISAEDLEDLDRMHQRYKKLGGNGYLDTLMGKVKALPIQNQ